MRTMENGVKKQTGFTLIEVMVTMAIAGILMAIAVPNYLGWRPKHDLNNAVSEYFSLLQKTRMTAIKDRSTCSFTYSSTAYSVSCTNSSFARTISLADYGSGVTFEKPGGASGVPSSGITFNSCGLSNQRYLYLTNKQKKSYYRIGPLISGAIMKEFWDGNSWESL